MALLTFEASLPHPDDTDRLGAHLADAVLKEADCVADQGLAMRLQGNLGAGKTSLVRAMLRRFGFAGPVKSPTFSLVETYPINALTLNHFDFYRFEEPEELISCASLDETYHESDSSQLPLSEVLYTPLTLNV